MTEKATVAALGFSIQCGVSDGRQIVVQTHLPVDATAGQIDSMLDRVMASLDRQGTKYAIEALEKDLQGHRDKLADMTTDFQRIQERDAKDREAWATGSRRGEYKEPAQNRQAREQALAMQERWKSEIAKRENEIAALKQKVAAPAPE